MKKQICAMTLILTMCLLTVGCGNIAEIKKWDKLIAVTIGEAEKIAQTAYDNKMYDLTVLKQIFTVTHRATLGQGQFNAVLSAYEKANPGKKEISIASAKQLLTLLEPISNALDPNKIAEIVGIKNEQTKQELIAKFNVARGFISSLQIVLAASASGGA